jgi:hypothetical protein
MRPSGWIRANDRDGQGLFTVSPIRDGPPCSCSKRTRPVSNTRGWTSRMSLSFALPSSIIPASTDLGEHHYCNIRRVNLISRIGSPGGQSTAQRTIGARWVAGDISERVGHSIAYDAQPLAKSSCGLPIHHGMRERSVLAGQESPWHQGSSKS